MQSFALWYERINTIESQKIVSAKLNFNLWTECGWGKSNKTQYLDIGFMINNINEISKLFMFVPFKNITQNNIKDLGCTLNEPNLAGAIFNENLKVQRTPTKLLFLKNLDNDSEFAVYELDTIKDYDINIENKNYGTVLSIDVKNNPTLSQESKPLYLRFRLEGLDFSELIHEYTAGKRGIQSIFNVVYTVDFRYMNKRSLSNSLLEQINAPNCESMNIEAIHFLLITKTHVDVKISCDSSRKLEDEIWDDYVNLEKIKKIKNIKKTSDLIAYHFKKKPKCDRNGEQLTKFIDSAEFFVKYSVEKSVLFLYITTSLLIGALGSLIGSLFIH